MFHMFVAGACGSFVPMDQLMSFLLISRTAILNSELIKSDVDPEKNMGLESKILFLSIIDAE